MNKGLKLGGLGGGSAPCCCGAAVAPCYIYPCSPCPLPKGDLTIEITGTYGCAAGGVTSFPFTQSFTMHFNDSTGVPTWTSDCLEFTLGAPCVGADSQMNAALTCSPLSGLSLTFTKWTNPLCAGTIVTTCTEGGFCTGCGGTAAFQRTSATCSPFELDYVVNACGQASAAFFNFPGAVAYVITSFKITGPNTSPGTCPICVVVTGCCGALEGASVTVGSASGTTDIAGYVSLDIGTAGSYAVSITSPGYTSFSATESFSCGQGIAVTLSVDGTDVCCCSCPDDPVPQTLTMTEPRFFAGGVTGTYYSDLVASWPAFTPVGGGNGFPSTGGWVATSTCFPTTPPGPPMTPYFLLQCVSGGFAMSAWFPAPAGPGGGPLRICTVPATGVTVTCDPFSASATCSDFAPCGGMAGTSSTVTWTA